MGHLELGEGVRVAAGSLVVRDAPAGATLAGSPAIDHARHNGSEASSSGVTMASQDGAREGSAATSIAVRALASNCSMASLTWCGVIDA
jgi:hypothetical protein